MTNSRERAQALLVLEATGSLSPGESTELEALLLAHPDIDRYAFARPAAAVFLASAASPSQPMPASLYSRVIAAAERSPEDGN